RLQNRLVKSGQPIDRRILVVERRQDQRRIRSSRSRVGQQVERLGQVRRSHLADDAELALVAQEALQNLLALFNGEGGELARGAQRQRSVGAAFGYHREIVLIHCIVEAAGAVERGHGGYDELRSRVLAQFAGGCAGNASGR